MYLCKIMYFNDKYISIYLPCCKCRTPKTTFRPVSIQVQLNPEPKVHTNTLSNINPETAYPTDTTQFLSLWSTRHKNLLSVYFTINVNLDTALCVLMLVPSIIWSTRHKSYQFPIYIYLSRKWFRNLYLMANQEAITLTP